MVIAKTLRYVCFSFLFSIPLICLNITSASDLDNDSSFNCEDGIVEIGDTKYQVLEKCGEPTMRTDNGNKWVYDLGSTQFVRYITFTDDKVHRIQHGDYGSP